MSRVVIEVCQSTSRWPSRRAQKWFWRVKAANGQTLLTSDMYTNYSDVVSIAETTFGVATGAIIREPNCDDRVLR